MGELRPVIDNIRDRVDLVELIKRDVDLKPVGSVLKGCSPSREDRDPSFVVWPGSQTWRDYSGGDERGGDCFDYVEARDGVSFMEALRSLAGEVGVRVPGHEVNPSELAERRGVERLLTEAARYYHRQLPPEIRAKWLQERYGFTDEIIDRLQLGWADNGLHKHLTQSLGATEAQALATGLLVRLKDGRVVDFFQGRLTFPYWRRGRVVYFIARKTELSPEQPWEQAKYKKLLTRSERHPYVSACVTNDTFYNEDAARGAERLLITEGVTDCISAMQAGVACVSPVTVRFRRKDLPKLIKLSEGAKEIIIANDVEESGAGAQGAADTANALHAAGRPVLIATLPRPDGQDKIDVNELVARDGPEALKRVMNEAKDWCAHLIEQIPEDVDARGLEAALTPIIPLLLTASPILQEAYGKQIKGRFKIKQATLDQLLNLARRQGLAEPLEEDEEALGAHNLRGRLLYAGDHYLGVGKHAPERISNFVMRAKRWISSPEGDVITVDIRLEGGSVIRNVELSHQAWLSRKSLLRELRSGQAVWMGSDDNVQALRYLLARQNPPRLQGSTNLGYGEDARGPYWLTPHEIIEPKDKRGLHKDVVWVNTGGPLYKRLSPLPKISRKEERALAAEALPLLLEVNTPEVMLPIIGWFFAAPLRAKIFEHFYNFPNLCVFGTQGSGKTSLIVRIMWPLLGVPSSVPFSATETEFALLRLLSATNSVPIFIDEYKPADMPRRRLETIHRLLRRLYTGESEHRGRADLSVVEHTLTAPLVLGGESRPIEPALTERMITANPYKTTIEGNRRRIDVFKRLNQLDLSRLSRGIIQGLLTRDVKRDHSQAAALLDGYLAEMNRTLPNRMRFNIEVAIMGLIAFEEHARGLGVRLPTMDLTLLIRGQIEDILGGRAQVKSVLDSALEILSALAASGDIEYGKQYVYSNGNLALHLPSCHNAYAFHCKRVDYTGEVVDLQALRRVIREAHIQGSYVISTSTPVYFNQVKRRAVLIDMIKAKADLEVDDFPNS